jgi:DNA-binding response OmpR family regulator
MTRILVVDDDRSTARMLVDYLTTEGYDAAVESDGLRALQHVDLRQPDMVILDLMLPILTGVEVAQRLRRDPGSQDIPILAITGVDSPDDLAEVLMVDSVLEKPLDLERLGEEIKNLLARAEDASLENTAYAAARVEVVD